ncbi:phytanoyl-CoA dioxygenase family protein [Cupriavidus basilensis]
MDPLLAEADPAMQHLNSSVAAFFGTRVRYLAGLAGKSMTFAEEVMCHPLYLALCDHFLLPNCADYQLNLGHLMERGPGAQAQMLHRDEAVWVHYQRPRPELQLATVVALVDFTRENGATIIAPGSHRLAGRTRSDRRRSCLRRNAGGFSRCTYLGSTMHAGGANTTRDQWRRGFHMSYALAGFVPRKTTSWQCRPSSAGGVVDPGAAPCWDMVFIDAIKQRGGYLGMVDMRATLELLTEGRQGRQFPPRGGAGVLLLLSF